MSHDIVSAEYVEDYKIRVTFENGKSGIVDFLPYIKKGGVYRKLRDKGLFKRFQINAELGVLTWGNTIDIAPETLYCEATGEPLPLWMYPAHELKKAV
jgi:hypothetical protein